MAAGLTSDELKGMASGLQEVTTFGDEAIIGAQNLLLTFTNIGGAGGIFERTTKVTADVATAMGMDLKGAAIQLGKALNDPATGLSMLTRVGITFSEKQKDVIKSLQATGDMAGAQTVILEELERQFGGSAEAAASTFGGAMMQVENAVNDVLEAIGNFIVDNAGVIAIVKEMASGVLDFATDLNKLGESQEGQTQIAVVFQKALVALMEGFAGIVEVLGIAGKAMADFAIWSADAVGSTALFTDEQKRLSYEMDIAAGIVAKYDKQITLLRFKDAASGTNGWAEEIKKLSAYQEHFAKKLRQARIDFHAARIDTDKMTDSSSAAADKLRELAGSLEVVDVAAAITAAETAKLAAKEKELAVAAASAAAAQAELNRTLGVEQVQSMKDLNREIFTYIDAFKRDFPDIAKQQSKVFSDFKKSLDDLPIPEQITRLEAYVGKLRSMWDATGAGSAKAVAAWNQVGEASESAGEKIEAVGEGRGVKKFTTFVLDAIGLVGDLGDKFKDVAGEAAVAAEKAKREWERSAEAMGDSLGNAFSDVWTQAIVDRDSFFEGFDSFTVNLKSTFASALLDPILGAGSPLADLFTLALKPITMLGSAIAEYIFRPMIDGIIAYFTTKEVVEKAEAVSAVGTHAITVAAITTKQMGAIAFMMPGLAAAAALAAVATLGSAWAAAGGLKAVIGLAMAEGKAAGALALASFAEGGFIDKAQLAMVGEGDKPEVIIPLSKPDRARDLLAQTFARHPDLFLSALGGKKSGSAGVGGINNFSITVNGAGDPRQTSAAVVARIDQMLGRRIKGKV
jgi:hypothetical protein